MNYSDYMASDAYAAAQSGAAVRVVIYKASDPSRKMIGRTSGINWNDAFEQNPVPEAGEHRILEISTGMHSGQASVQGFWSPEKNDVLPYSEDFIVAGDGEEYVIMEVSGSKRLGDELPFNVCVGAKINQYGSAHGATGLKTFSLGFVYTQRFPGKAWAELTGNA